VRLEMHCLNEGGYNNTDASTIDGHHNPKGKNNRRARYYACQEKIDDTI